MCVCGFYEKDRVHLTHDPIQAAAWLSVVLLSPSLFKDNEKINLVIWYD